MNFIDERLLNVDKSGALKVPTLVLVSLAILCRYWIVVVVVLVLIISKLWQKLQQL